MSSIGQILTGQDALLYFHGHALFSFPELVLTLIAVIVLLKKGVDWASLLQIPFHVRLAIVLFFLGGIVGAVFSGNVIHGLTLFKSWFFFPALMAALLVLAAEKYRGVSLVILWSAVVLLLFGMVQIKLAFCAAVLFLASSAVSQMITKNLLVRVLLPILIIGGLFLGGFLTHNSSITTRDQVWQAGLVTVTQQPLTGIGLDNFPLRYSDATYTQPSVAPLEGVSGHPYNGYLAVWLYGGVIGLVGLLLVLFESLSTSRSNYFVPIILIGGFSFFNTPFYTLQWSYLVWLALAAAVAGTLQKRQTSLASS